MSVRGRVPDVLPFTKADLRLPMTLRKGQRNSISGVQSKVLLSIVDGEFSVVDKGGDFILKPVPEDSLSRFAADIPANENLTMQIASRLMARTGGGSIVNIASITGVVGSPGQVAYSSTKGAVIAATKSAAKELSPMQIRVNAVAPGIIKTERFEELYEASGDKIDQRISRIALGRLGTPQDVANAVAFLASDRASYISGHILGVDGCASI